MGYTWVTQSQRVFPGRAKLYGVILTATDAGAADITLYAGRDDAAPVIAVIKAPAGRSIQARTLPGIELPDGLYIAVGSNVEGVLVLWEPV